MNNNNRQLARRQPMQPVQIPKKGYVTIAGQRHFVSLTPYHQPQHQAIVQHQEPAQPLVAEPSAQYQVPQRRQQSSVTAHILITPTSIVLGFATAVAILGAAFMFIRSMDGYSYSIDNTRRLNRIIHVEP